MVSAVKAWQHVAERMFTSQLAGGQEIQGRMGRLDVKNVQKFQESGLQGISLMQF